MRKTVTTSADALERMREICLSLPGTSEKSHFGEAAFYVKGRLFATCGDKHGVCEIIFGLEPARAAALVKNDSRFTPYARDARGVVLDASKVTSWSEVEGLVRESYELRKAPRPRAKPAKRTARRKPAN